MRIVIRTSGGFFRQTVASRLKKKTGISIFLATRKKHMV